MPNHINRLNLDRLHRDDLPDLPNRIAGALDDWAHRQYGVTTSQHGVGLLLDLLADQGLTIVDTAGRISPGDHATIDFDGVPVTGLVTVVDDYGRATIAVPSPDPHPPMLITAPAHQFARIEAVNA